MTRFDVSQAVPSDAAHLSCWNTAPSGLYRKNSVFHVFTQYGVCHWACIFTPPPLLGRSVTIYSNIYNRFAYYSNIENTLLGMGDR